jgi:hypothetical protein
MATAGTNAGERKGRGGVVGQLAMVATDGGKCNSPAHRQDYLGSSGSDKKISKLLQSHPRLSSAPVTLQATRTELCSMFMHVPRSSVYRLGLVIFNPRSSGSWKRGRSNSKSGMSFSGRSVSKFQQAWPLSQQ